MICGPVKVIYNPVSTLLCAWDKRYQRWRRDAESKYKLSVSWCRSRPGTGRTASPRPVGHRVAEAGWPVIRNHWMVTTGHPAASCQRLKTLLCLDLEWDSEEIHPVTAVWILHTGQNRTTDLMVGEIMTIEEHRSYLQDLCYMTERRKQNSLRSCMTMPLSL